MDPQAPQAEDDNTSPAPPNLSSVAGPQPLSPAQQSVEPPQTPQSATPESSQPTASEPQQPAPIGPLAGPATAVPVAAAPPADPTLAPLPPASAAPTTVAPGNNKKVIFGAVVGIVILAIVSTAVYLLLPKHAGSGPKLLVDKNPYLYACSANQPDLMAKTLNYNTDRNNQSVQTTFQIAPDNTKDKQLDLLSLTGAQSTNNSCQLFAVDTAATQANPTPNTHNIYASIDQYPNAQDAMQALNDNKEDSDQPLPAFPTSSFYSQPEADQSDPSQVSVSAFIAYKSSMLGYIVTAPVGAQSSQYVDAFTTLAKAAMANIDNGTAAKVTTFQHYTTFSGHPYVDACTAVNYAKLLKLVAGGSQLDPDGVTATLDFGKGTAYSDPQALTSVCSFTFRTNAEQQEEAQHPLKLNANADAGSNNTDNYDINFSHSLSIGVTTLASGTDVQKAEQQYTKGQGAKLTPVKINGQNGYKASSTQKDDSGNTLDISQYFVPKGNYLYTLQIVLRRQSKPYQTTNYVLSDADAAKLYDIVMQAK